MELFVKICLKIKKNIFESLFKLFVKKDVVYHFNRRTIRHENPLLSGKVNRQHNNNYELLLKNITVPKIKLSKLV